MQHGRRQPGSDEDPAALARSLEPALAEACRGRLRGAVEWFTSSWQRGGAATGNAAWDVGPGAPELPVIIKLPVGHRELVWTDLLGRHGSDRDILEGETPHPTPRVLAAGDSLGSVDLGWVVLERLEGEPVSRDLSAPALRGLVAAAVEFQDRARRVRHEGGGNLPGGIDDRDWAGIVELSRGAVRDHSLEHEQAWLDLLAELHRHLDDILREWQGRPVDDWCHGDLHPGNAIHMAGGDGHPDRTVLIDLGLVHRGHWTEDAVYLERVFWGHETKLGGIEPVRLMRKLRRDRGLRVGEQDGRLANIKRVLTAASVPARLAAEGGDAAYHARSLEILRRRLPALV
ncbi:MAG: aminoglycoside phosphotransferase family protein [Planctomycetota bacterium]